MHTSNEQIAFLNDFFLPEIWQAAGDLLGNLSLSQADDFVRTFPLCNGLQSSSFNFTQPPGAALLNPNSVRFLLPGNGQHHLDTTINISSPLPNADLGVGLSLQVDASAGLPVPAIDVNVSFNWGGAISDFFLALTNFPAFLAKKAIEAGIEEGLESLLSNRIRDRLSGALSYRFDRALDLQGPAGAAQIIGLFPASFGGSRDPLAAGYVDLLIVADGFTAADSANFDDFASFVSTYLTAHPETPFFTVRNRVADLEAASGGGRPGPAGAALHHSGKCARSHHVQLFELGADRGSRVEGARVFRSQSDHRPRVPNLGRGSCRCPHRRPKCAPAGKHAGALCPFERRRSLRSRRRDQASGADERDGDADPRAGSYAYRPLSGR